MEQVENVGSLPQYYPKEKHMKMKEFREATKDYPDDAEIVVAGGTAIHMGLEHKMVDHADHPALKHTAKVWSIAGSQHAVILEL